MDSIVRFFQEGGAFMYPIAIVMAIGLAIVGCGLVLIMERLAAGRVDGK